MCANRQDPNKRRGARTAKRHQASFFTHHGSVWTGVCSVWSVETRVRSVQCERAAELERGGAAGADVVEPQTGRVRDTDSEGEGGTTPLHAMYIVEY